MTKFLTAFTFALIAITPLAGLGQAHSGQMDTDGILSPGEIPNPNIRYGNRYPQQYADSCANMSRSQIGRPRIEIDRVKSTGNLFGDKVKVRGTIEGVCLAEAGLFEDGRKVDSIPISTSEQFRRFEFEVKTKLDNDPEIRAYTTSGDRDIEPIEADR